MICKSKSLINLWSQPGHNIDAVLTQCSIVSPKYSGSKPKMVIILILTQNYFARAKSNGFACTKPPTTTRYRDTIRDGYGQRIRLKNRIQTTTYAT